MRVYIIAEAGVNHNGQIDLAKKLIDVAKEAGADAVKFQTFKTEEMVTKTAKKAKYQLQHTSEHESQFEMIKQLELSVEDHFILRAYAQDKKIDFLSTPFDLTSLDLLTKDLGLETIKVSSGDLTNAPLVYEIASRAKKVILSTGMALLSEIEEALGVLAYGFLNQEKKFLPSLEAFRLAYASEQGQKMLKERVMLLHCTSEYPAPESELNLKVINTLKHAFGLEVGYSDHTLGTHISIAAVAMGASIIEKHFTLDKNMIGPDHQASLTPEELKYMVASIRSVTQSFGDGIKRPMKSEMNNRSLVRKSLVAASNIKRGARLELACKRPGDGLSPYLYWEQMNSMAKRDYLKDELIEC